MTVMADYDALSSEARKFLAGGPLVPLREWIEEYDEPVSQSEDVRFRRLDSDVWSLVSRGDLAELTEAGIRDQLGVLHPELLAPVVTEVTGAVSLRWVGNVASPPMLVTRLNVSGTGSVRRGELTPA